MTNRISRRRSRIALEAQAIGVTAFLNPLQAVEAMKRRRFDIGLFDLKMQPIDGIQLLREARDPRTGDDRCADDSAWEH